MASLAIVPTVRRSATSWKMAVLRKSDDDPFGRKDSEDIAKKKLDAALPKGDVEAAGIVQSAIEEFAQELAAVIRRFLRLKTWRGTERIVVGGGFRASRIGELVIGRASVLLRAKDLALNLEPIRSDPDEAGLIGAAHLAPLWMFKGHDAILAVDIGGSNIRVGVVELNLKKKRDLSKATVWKFERWRHCDEKGVTRGDAVATLIAMLKELIGDARKEKLRMAPFIGIGCPGLIAPDGTIKRGGENLPGRWQGKGFNLPRALIEKIPKLQEQHTVVVMHNDAGAGTERALFMDDVKRWGVTIGTGLGNAQFRNRGRSAAAANPRFGLSRTRGSGGRCRHRRIAAQTLKPKHALLDARPIFRQQSRIVCNSLARRRIGRAPWLLNLGTPHTHNGLWGNSRAAGLRPLRRHSQTNSGRLSMKRRDFLKSTAALAGAGMVSAPAIWSLRQGAEVAPGNAADRFPRAVPTTSTSMGGHQRAGLRGVELLRPADHPRDEDGRRHALLRPRQVQGRTG